MLQRLHRGKEKNSERLSNDQNLIELDPREDPKEDILTLTKELKKVQIGSKDCQTTQIGSNLSYEEEVAIIKLLKDNLDLFVWTPSNMLGIDPEVVCHHISLDPS